MSLKTLDFPDVQVQHITAEVSAMAASGIKRGDNIVFLGAVVFVEDMQPIGDHFNPTAYILKMCAAL